MYDNISLRNHLWLFVRYDSKLCVILFSLSIIQINK